MTETSTEELKNYQLPAVPNKIIEKYKKELAIDVKKAESFIVSNDEDKAALSEIGKRAGKRSKFFTALFENATKEADKLHKARVAEREEFVTPYNNIYKIAITKVNTYDHEKAETERLELIKRQEEEQAKRQRALTLARDKIDKLLEGTQDLQVQLNTLNTMLEEGKLSEEEAEIVRGKVEVTEQSIQNKQDKVDTVVAKVEEKAPVIAPIAKKVEPKNWTAEVVDVKALCQAIIDDKVPVGIIKTFDLVTIQKVRKLGQEYPGISYTPDYSKGKRL